MAFARRHRLVVELALLALVAYLAAIGAGAGARLALDDVPAAPDDAAAATEPAAGPAPLADYAVIAERDVFNPGGAARDARRTLRLWGVALDGRDARAVIEDATTHRQELYRVGDDVDGARIVAIDWDRVTLARAGGEDVLELEAAPPPTGAPERA